MASDLYFPYNITASGRTRQATRAEHLQQLMELVLLTNPGDRVNWPDFGAGLLQSVFSPASTALSGTVEALVQSALLQWMSELIRVDAVTVEVSADGNGLDIVVVYTDLATNHTATATFTQPMLAGV